ncbi:DUF7453 family protein [Halomonas denitrificans]|nr:hypothetical protein [Halomonas denitrificans]
MVLRRLALAAVAFVATSAAIAQTVPILIGRSGPVDGFLIPGNTGFSNNDVALNEAGEAALRLSSIGVAGSRGIWFGDGTTGDVVATGDPSWFFTDADLNNAAEIVWAQTDTPANGIYRWDPVGDTVSLVTAQPLGTSSWGTVQINDAGTIGFRATFGGGGRAWASYTSSGTLNIHAAEAAIQPGSPWDFLFTPSFNAAGQIGGKALLAAGGNQIIRTGPDGGFDVLVSDQAADGGSPFTSLDNSPVINDSGDTGFIATVAGQRGVWFSDGTITEQLAAEGEDGVGDIEFFGPAIDNQGRVAFRAFDAGTGRRAIWLAESGQLPRRLVGAGDLVDTDLGPARIDSPSGIEFSGGVTINEAGEVAYIAVLTAPDNVNDVYGLGVLRQAFAAELLFADGFEPIPRERRGP